MYSGKTTLAKELERRGYKRLDFTGQLKSLLSTAIQTSTGKIITPRDMEVSKPKYRRLLQEFGEAIGYSTDSYYVHLLLLAWDWDQPSVFDNVRTPEQWEVLRARGFTLVALSISRSAQERRAEELGEYELDTALQHPIEQTEMHHFAHRELGGTRSAVDLAQYLMEERDA